MKDPKEPTPWDTGGYPEVYDPADRERSQRKAHAIALAAEQRALLAEADAAQMRRERDAVQARLETACQSLHDLADSLDTKGLVADVDGMPSLACTLVLASNSVRDTLAKLAVPTRGAG
jgi:hypothetical protein